MVNQKIWHVAWTVDDGPTPHTSAMAENFPGKTRPATWYIVRDRLTKSNMCIYRRLQDEGHEIAIHGLHPTQNHLSWFPGQPPNKKFETYQDFSTAMDDLESFYEYLMENGFFVNFVRAPYGLNTEVLWALKKEGQSKAALKDAHNVIKGRVSPTDPPAMHKVAANMGKLRTKLKELNLHLWGGDPGGNIYNKSWEFESAAANTGRTDSLNASGIRDKLTEIGKRATKMASDVILCHDTTKADVIQVKDDIKEMEKQANKDDTKLVYHTMTQLFKLRVGRDPYPR